MLSSATHLTLSSHTQTSGGAGDVSIYPGTSVAAAPSVLVTAGVSTGAGGSVQISPGRGGLASGTGGALSIIGGQGNTGADVVFKVQAGSGGQHGKFIILDDADKEVLKYVLKDLDPSKDKK